jgi:hypothetical protein
MIRAPVMAMMGLLPQMGNSMLFLLSFKSGRGNSGIGGVLVVVEILDKIKGFCLFLQTELLLPFCQIFEYRHHLVIYLSGSDCCP